jgi:hypothetical protein
MKVSAIIARRITFLLRFVGRFWHLTDKSVLPIFVRFRTMADIDGS